MRPLRRGELLDLAAYEPVRDRFLGRVVAEKKRRRVALGPDMTALFENRDTVLFQIQEMLRTERITAEAGVLHELETYNELIPGDSELSATVFVEYTDREERDRMLVALAGLESCFSLEVGGRRFPARNETRGTRTDRTTAVHYLKLPLSPEARSDLLGGAGAVLVVEHPRYTARADLAEATLAALREDLAGD